ncbi:hypothetical protein ACVJGC_008133 [Bradyrhizobium diazoefficiens]
MWGSPKANSKYSFVYVLRDRNHRNRFKIGMSGDDPVGRAKHEDWRIYGKKDGLPASIEVVSVWSFLTPDAAYYVEQSIIQLLRCKDYNEIDQNNWFEIDYEDLQFFLKGLETFIAKTQRNAGDVLFQSDARRRDKPYGKFYWAWIKSLGSASVSNPTS